MMNISASIEIVAIKPAAAPRRCRPCEQPS
jgi:hypothetical protein